MSVRVVIQFFSLLESVTSIAIMLGVVDIVRDNTTLHKVVYLTYKLET